MTSSKADHSSKLPPLTGFDCRLMGWTMPSPELQEVEGVDTPSKLLAYLARVSNEGNQGNHTTGASLIRGLVKREEWSPLEMLDVLVEIHGTRDIGRQILRHTSLRPQEFSQRYALVDTNKPIIREARLQHPTDRQASIELDYKDDEHKDIAQAWGERQQSVWEHAITNYNWAIQEGLAKECARVVLPEGLTATRMYFKGNLRDWYHYTRIRTKLSTQKEHRVIAQKCWALVLTLFPELPNHQASE